MGDPAASTLFFFLSAEYWKGESRDDFQPSDVQDYFMYMGMLASEVGGCVGGRGGGGGFVFVCVLVWVCVLQGGPSMLGWVRLGGAARCVPAMHAERGWRHKRCLARSSLLQPHLLTSAAAVPAAVVQGSYDRCEAMLASKCGLPACLM